MLYIKQVKYLPLTFLLGMIAVAPVFVLQHFISNALTRFSFMSEFSAALFEEVFKVLAALIGLKLSKKTSFVHIILFYAVSAFGFSFVENAIYIKYAFEREASYIFAITIFLKRFYMNTPGHILATLITGFVHAVTSPKWKILRIVLMIATILAVSYFHAIHNLCDFSDHVC